MRDYPGGYLFSSIKVLWILWMSFALRQGYWIIARPYQNTHYKYSGGGKFPSLCSDKTKPWRCFRPKEAYKVILFLFVFGGKNWYAGIVMETNRKVRKWRKAGVTNWVFIERVKNKINCSKPKLISGGDEERMGRWCPHTCIDRRVKCCQLLLQTHKGTYHTLPCCDRNAAEVVQAHHVTNGLMGYGSTCNREI